MRALPIDPNEVQKALRSAARLSGSQESSRPGFREMLDGYLKEVNAMQQEADKAVHQLATGKMDNLHQVVVAMNEADLSFRLMMQMRNRLVEAYKEIIRMQV